MSAQCKITNPTLTTIFFYKDDRLLFSHKAIPNETVYTLPLHISQYSGGQYYCGYRQKNGNNLEKKSTLSAFRNLIVLPGKSSAMTGHVRIYIEDDFCTGKDVPSL